MNVNTELVIFLVMNLLTGGMIVEHSKLAIIPFIIAVIFGILLIIKNQHSELNNNKITILDDDKGQIDVGALGAMVIFVIFILVVIMVIGLLGTYRISTGEGAILTEVDGDKVPVTDVGWHTRFPILSDLTKYSIVNNNIYFPSDYIVLENQFTADKQAGAIGFDIKTTDDKVVDVGAVMSYEIVDLIQFGVKNTNPYEQLQKAYDATVFNYLQSQSSDKITSQVTIVNAELLQKLKESNIEEQFGIKLNSVSLLRPTFTKIALDALAEKQAIQAKSEGELNAARNRAEAIETIAKAQKNQSDILKNVPQEQLNFNAKLALYDTLKGQQNVIWVIPSEQSIVLSK